MLGSVRKFAECGYYLKFIYIEWYPGGLWTTNSDSAETPFKTHLEKAGRHIHVGLLKSCFYPELHRL